MVISPFGPGLWRVLGNGEDKTLSYPFHLWEGEAFIMKNGNSLVLTKRVLTIIFHKTNVMTWSKFLAKVSLLKLIEKGLNYLFSPVAGLYA